MKRRPLPYGFHYNIPAAFDPSVSYDMQYQRLREIVYSIIDNMEIHIPYMIFTTEAHTNDVVTLTGSFYTDHKEVLANKTFSLKGLPDGTYYININAKYKFETCEPDCSCVKAISPDSDMTLETVYMPDGGITLYTVVRKNGEITTVNYNDIYTGMHNIATDAHENRFIDVYANIKAEVDRATAAEETLQRHIDDETARAMDAENVLDEKIKAEQNRATAAEHTLQDNINKEQARAEQAESTLQANITAETNRATTAEDGLQKAIDAERTRAVAAEGNLQKNIDNEVANRTAADTAERERAVNAENELAGDIAAESADRQRADTALDTKLTGLINAEETRATQAENDIKTALDTEETARINADSKEINDRTAADTALGKRIDTEVSNRTAADTAERDRAVNAENELAGDIAAESADRQRADTALDTKLTGLINAEETRATQAENDIKTALDTEETARINADSKEINDRTAADTALGKRIDTEVSNRTAADTAERDRAVAAEENLQTQVTQLQEAGPGFKQDVFSDVEGINDGNVIKLSNFKYWDKATKDFVEKSGAKLYLANLILETLQFGTPSDTSYLKLVSSTAHGGFSAIRIMTQEGQPLLIISVDEISMIGNLTMGPVKFTANNIEDSSVLRLEGVTEDKVILRGIKDGASDDSAINKKQLDTKQDKITASSVITLAAATVEALNVRGLKGYGSITCDGTNFKFTIGEANKAELTNIKDGTADDSAASVAQLNVVNDLAHTANQAAGIAQNDLNLLKPRVTALENNVTFGAITLNDTNVSATQPSTQGEDNLTINAASLKFQQVYGDLYMLSGYINLTAASQELIQMTIDLKPTVNKEFSSIFTTVTGDSGLSQQRGNGYVHSYTIVDDDNGNHTKIRVPYLPSATGAKTIGISIMAKLTNI